MVGLVIILGVLCLVLFGAATFFSIENESLTDELNESREALASLQEQVRQSEADRLIKAENRVSWRSEAAKKGHQTRKAKRAVLVGAE